MGKWDNCPGKWKPRLKSHICLSNTGHEQSNEPLNVYSLILFCLSGFRFNIPGISVV